jgi:hypothetical protein
MASTCSNVAEGMRMTKLSEAGFAYVAGLFDGEGYIRCSFGPHWHGRRENMEFWITVTNSYKPVLVYLQSTLGGSIHANPPEKPSKHRMSWFWKLGPRGTLMLLSRMAPYLQIKREAANLVLSNKALITKKGPRKEGEKIRLRRLSKKIGALTKRGVSDDMITA